MPPSVLVPEPPADDDAPTLNVDGLGTARFDGWQWVGCQPLLLWGHAVTWRVHPWADVSEGSVATHPALTGLLRLIAEEHRSDPFAAGLGQAAESLEPELCEHRSAQWAHRREELTELLAGEAVVAYRQRCRAPDQQEQALFRHYQDLEDELARLSAVDFVDELAGRPDILFDSLHPIRVEVTQIIDDGDHLQPCLLFVYASRFIHPQHLLISVIDGQAVQWELDEPKGWV